MASSITISLSEHAGGVIQVTAVPPTALSLKITSHRMDGHTLVVQASGPVDNLPDQTSCTASWHVSRDDAPTRVVSGGAVPLGVSGSTGKVELRLDVIAAGLLDRGHVSLELTPDFPPYTPCTVGGQVPFDLPCGVEMTGLQSSMMVGHGVQLQPRRHAAFEACTLRLRLSEVDEKGDDDDEDEGAGWDLAWEWGPGESETRAWRVGCTDDDGDPVLTLPDPGEKGSADLRLSVQLQAADGTTTTVSTERCQVARPRLTRLQLTAHNDAMTRFSWEDPGAALRWLRGQPADKDLRLLVEGTITGIAPGFAFPVEVTLWGRRTLAGRPDVEVMEPLTRPVVGATDESGHVEITAINLATIRAQDQLNRYLGYEYFAVLRLPPAATGTSDHIAVAQGLAYDASTFVPFLDEDFATAIAGTNKQTGKTTKELGTGVCSTDLGAIRPIRLPHFGPLGLSVRGTKLVVSSQLHGVLHFWGEAEPKIVLHVDDGTEIELATAARADDPRAMEGSISMRDKRLVGKCLRASIEVTRDDATLDGVHCVGTPAAMEANYECTPQLGPVQWVVEQQGDVRVGRVLCATRFFPTYPGAEKGLRMQVAGYYEGIEGPVPLGVDLRYAIPDGRNDGRAGASGLLEAWVTDQEQIERIEAGRAQVEVWRHYDGGKVYDMAVPKARYEFGTGARCLPAGQIIFASKVSATFKANVLLVASQLGFDPNYLMAVMAFETGEKFLPTKYSSSGAVGLIQFTTAGATTVKSTKTALAKLTAEQQLFEVRKYYQYWIDIKGSVTTLEDAYMVVFCPSGVGQSLDHVLYSAAKDAANGTRHYSANSGLDTDGSKTITKLEAAAKVRDKYQAGLADLG